MRIFPIALIAVGAFGLLKHFGFISPEFLHLFWPLLLIGLGLAMLARGPRWRSDMRERRQDRWEHRMHRKFGPGWASLSEEERERFRTGMQQWRYHDGGQGGDSPKPGSANPGTSGASPAQAKSPSNPQ